jgi:hypothetical protein
MPSRLSHTMSLSQRKLPISSLPLCSKSRSLQHNLNSDPATPSHSEFIQKVLTQNPSVQRRSRIVTSNAHFSFVNPLLLPFPYEISPPDEEEDKTAFVERWLSQREPLEKRPPLDGTNPSHLHKYSSAERDKFPERHLLGIAPAALRDCLPQLDVGDAFEVIGKPALLPDSKDPNGLPENGDEKARKIREELVDVLGGHTVLTSDGQSDDQVPYLPWSLRYCGHQFGVWAGQLGDGRAISLSD